MNKLLLSLSFFALGFLTLTTAIAPDTAAVWLASTTQNMDYIRLGVMGMLLVLIFTNPPRRMALRYVIGSVAISIITGSGYATYQNMMQVLDGIALLAAGISSLVAALEYGSKFDKEMQKENTKFKYSTSAA